MVPISFFFDQSLPFTSITDKNSYGQLFINEMVTLFLLLLLLVEQLKLRPHAQCFRQFDAKVVKVVRAEGANKAPRAPAVFAANAIKTKHGTKQKV